MRLFISLLIVLFSCSASLGAMKAPRGGGVAASGASQISQATLKCRINGGTKAFRIGVYKDGSLQGYSDAHAMTETTMTEVTVQFSTPITVSAGVWKAVYFMYTEGGSLYYASNSASTYSASYYTGATYPTFPSTLPTASGVSLGEIGLQLKDSGGTVLIGPSSLSTYTNEVDADTSSTMFWQTDGYTI